MRAWLRVVRLALVLLAGTPLTAASAQGALDSAGVRALYLDWFAAPAARGFDAYASFYAADGYMLPPSSPPVVGRSAIAAWMRETQASLPYQIQPEAVTEDELRFLSPDWVLHRSTLRGQRVRRDGTGATQFETKYVDLLHRTADGRWEVAFRMWSDNR